jgi:hypothetical protein
VQVFYRDHTIFRILRCSDVFPGHRGIHCYGLHPVMPLWAATTDEPGQMRVETSNQYTPGRNPGAIRGILYPSKTIASGLNNSNEAAIRIHAVFFRSLSIRSGASDVNCSRVDLRPAIFSYSVGHRPTLLIYPTILLIDQPKDFHLMNKQNILHLMRN